MTNKAVGNLLLSGYAMAQSFMVSSAIRMHPEEFMLGVGTGGAAAEMALNGNITTTTEALLPESVAKIQARIKKHAPLHWTGPTPSPPPSPTPSPSPSPSWPKAVGCTCSAAFSRCIQVPGGGAYSQNNTKRGCAEEPASCPPLRRNEWVAIATSFTYDAKARTAAFRSNTALKKSTINSSLLPGDEVVPVDAGQTIKLLAVPTARFKVDEYTYVMLECADARCHSA